MSAPWRWPTARVHALFFAGLLIWTALECFGPLSVDAIASSTFDQMQRHRLWASAPDPRLLIIDIDERSLAEMAPEFGRWPWPRDTLATMLEHARTHGAAAVVFDILFSDPDRLRPGGDRALEAAVRASPLGFYPVARLPAALDGVSALHADQVPGLVIAPEPRAAAPTVALILPFMHAMVESAHLGTHTATLDGDGKIRRFAFDEALPGGWFIRSMPAIVAAHLKAPAAPQQEARLIVWRDRADAYPRVPFSVAWRCADGALKTPECPDLAGRILIVGASASSLYDIKATPLANQHMGVDILATLIDNALHGRRVHELPTVLRWSLAAAALAAAYLVVRRGAGDASGRALWGLPLLLLAIGYASLHSEAFYIDLTLPATAALSFLSLVKLHDALRRHLFSLRPDEPAGPQAVVCCSTSADSERVERAVYDLAATRRLRVSGLKQAAGPGGAAHSIWALWGIDDAGIAAGIEAALRLALPNAWCHAFVVSGEPSQNLLREAAARATLPVLPPDTRSVPQEVLNVPSSS